MINRVLFLIEKYCDANPACGPSGAEHQVVGAVRSTGLVGKTKHFYYDELCQGLGREMMSRLLLEDCQVFRPDLIIYTPLGGDIGQRLNPSHETMQRIMEMGIKVFLNLWDAPERGLEKQWLPSATLLGVDSLIHNYRNYKHLANVIFMHSTINPRVHYDRGLERNIDVSFVGSIDPADVRWPLRAECTRYLRDNGINILLAGGQRGKSRLTIDQCAQILSRSKISLDFCWSTDRTPTLHLRTFEVMVCGAMLLSDNGTLAGELFEEGKEFVIFETKEELLRLVRYYLEHDEERKVIAAAGQWKAVNMFNAANMWGYVFERMGFEIPQSLANDENYREHKMILESL